MLRIHGRDPPLHGVTAREKRNRLPRCTLYTHMRFENAANVTSLPMLFPRGARAIGLPDGRFVSLKKIQTFLKIAVLPTPPWRDEVFKKKSQTGIYDFFVRILLTTPMP